MSEPIKTVETFSGPGLYEKNGFYGNPGLELLPDIKNMMDLLEPLSGCCKIYFYNKNYIGIDFVRSGYIRSGSKDISIGCQYSDKKLAWIAWKNSSPPNEKYFKSSDLCSEIQEMLK